MAAMDIQSRDSQNCGFDLSRKRCQQCIDAKVPSKVSARSAQYHACSRDVLAAIIRNICGCCGSTLGDHACLDHDHESGLPRDMVCRRCNNLLAGVDDKQFLDAALSYLSKHKKSAAKKAATASVKPVDRPYSAVPITTLAEIFNVTPQALRTRSSVHKQFHIWYDHRGVSVARYGDVKRALKRHGL